MDRKHLIEKKMMSLKRSIVTYYRLTYLLWAVALLFIVIILMTHGYNLKGQPFTDVLKDVWPSVIPFSGSGYLMNVVPQIRERKENLEYFHSIVHNFHKLPPREQELIDSQIFLKK